jgi:hypothetical protein
VLIAWSLSHETASVKQRSSTHGWPHRVITAFFRRPGSWRQVGRILVARKIVFEIAIAMRGVIFDGACLLAADGAVLLE